MKQSYFVTVPGSQEAVILIFAFLSSQVICEDSDFDHFTLALQWPPSICHHYRINQLTRPCIVNDTVDTWITFGLWPTKGSRGKPKYCSRKWIFDYTEIEEVLEYKLLQYWPDLSSSKKNESLWKEEFRKHATCGLDVQEISGELKYFRKALSLNRRVDIKGLLKSFGITPRPAGSYKYIRVQEVLREKLGADVVFGCTHSKHDITQYLGQIEVCFSKDFERIINCRRTTPNHDIESDASLFNECRVDKPFTYLPIVQRNYYSGAATLIWVQTTILWEVVLLITVQSV